MTPIDEFYKLKKSPGDGLCHVQYCKNQRAYCWKKEKWNSRLCPKHSQRRWRACNPIQSAFRACIDHARARNLHWGISFADFKHMCEATSYVDAKGTTRHALTIDRKDACKGYTLDNVQVITQSENAAKSNRERYLPEHVKAILRRQRGGIAGEPKPKPMEQPCLL